MKALTDIQRKALDMMAEKNEGAVLVRGIWVWPCDIRSDEVVAQAVIEAIQARGTGLYF